MNPQEVNDLAIRLRNIQAKHRPHLTFQFISEQLTELESEKVGPTNVRSWIVTGKGPRIHKHQEALLQFVTKMERELSRSRQELPPLGTLQTPPSLDVQSVAIAINLVLSPLKRIVKNTDPQERIRLETSLGEQFQLFLLCARALSSEKNRTAILAEYFSIFNPSQK